MTDFIKERKLIAALFSNNIVNKLPIKKNATSFQELLSLLTTHCHLFLGIRGVIFRCLLHCLEFRVFLFCLPSKARDSSLHYFLIRTKIDRCLSQRVQDLNSARRVTLLKFVVKLKTEIYLRFLQKDFLRMYLWLENSFIGNVHRNCHLSFN